MSFFRVIGGREDSGNTAVEIAADVNTNALKVFQVNNPTFSVTPTTPSEKIDDALTNGNTSFFGSHYVEVDRNDFLAYEIVVPDEATDWFYCAFQISCQYECKIDLLEGGSIVSNTAITLVNRNRNSATVTAATLGFIASGTDPVTGGTNVYTESVGSERVHTYNESGDLFGYFVLSNDETYILRIESERRDNLISSQFRIVEIPR